MGNLDSLPAEIILDILRRLKIDSVIQYRLVSRTWNHHVYHRLLDYLKETEIQLESRLKRLKSCPLADKEPIYNKIHEVMELVEQGIVNVQKSSGGPGAFFEFGKQIHLKKITDKNAKLYSILLNRNMWVQRTMKLLQLEKQRRLRATR